MADIAANVGALAAPLCPELRMGVFSWDRLIPRRSLVIYTRLTLAGLVRTLIVLERVRQRTHRHECLFLST